MSFFNGFTFDTLIAIISCIAAVLALFLGGKANRKYKTLENSFNDKKKYGNNCIDNSQKAGGNIIINKGIGVEHLPDVTNTIAEAYGNSISKAIDNAYLMFQEKCDSNLKAIFEHANRIVQDRKLELGSYSKIDWINIYFESAKNSSDEYMQIIWARVLAIELSNPGSFSYKTLDVLKNMTSDSFILFEKMSGCAVDDYILSKRRYLEFCDFRYDDILKMSEHGLIVARESKKNYSIPARESEKMIFGDNLIIIGNPSENKTELGINAYPLTTAACELKAVLELEYSMDRAKKIMNEIHDTNDKIKITLHQINSINDGEIAFDLKELYSVG